MTQSPAGAVSYALVSPLVARLAVRFVQRAMLRPRMLAFAAATAALIGGAQARAPVRRVSFQHRQGVRPAVLWAR
jgi:hypothetical protein